MFLKSAKEKITWEHPHFWWDTTMLLLLWGAAIIVPNKIDKVAVAQIVRILALIATLEMGSFIAYQIFGKSKSTLLQGFIGGLASSTTVFVQMTRDSRFAQLPKKQLASSLLLSAVAMLVESFFISLGLAANNTLLLVILLQAIILIFFISKYLASEQDDVRVNSNDFQINHPILWKRVLKLSAFIALLIGMMTFITRYLPIPNWLTVLLTSLFEAHAVLAAVLLEETHSLLGYYVLISLGNTLSKAFLVWRSKIPGLLSLVTVPLITTVALAGIFAFIIG